MAYKTIDNPELYFQADLYTGNGSNDHAQTFDGDENMQPDMVWIKSRSDAENHHIFDSVRGANARLLANTTGAEFDDSSNLQSFDSDGFTLGTADGINKNTATFVCWGWKANGSGSANTDGSINTTATSANTTAGFSIIEWSGSAAAATIGHGLGAVPKMIICKDTSDTYNWGVYHHKNTSAPETDYLYLNTTAATADSDSVWNDTAPTSTLFSVKNAGATNASGTNNMIAYCFAEKQGFSKFGSYTGNGNANGVFVYTGFRPAFLMVKKSSGTSAWYIYDNKRAGYNPDNNQLYPDRNNAEDTTDQVDFLSNGFKWQGITGDPNGSATYVYMAIAEAPLVNSEGVPCNAR